MPGRAIRATSPRSRSQARCSAEKYALSARSLTGRGRRAPGRDRTAGMPRMSGLRARLSCMFAPDAATASGMPSASDSACRLRPFLPRSTRFGPVSDPPFWRERWPRRPSTRSSAPRPGPEFVEYRPVQPTPQAGLDPYREAAVCGGGRRAERRRQMPSGTAAGQRVHHCREHGPLVTRSGPTTLRASSERRKQRGGKLQEFITNQTLGRSAPTAGIVPHGHHVTRDNLYALIGAADLAACSIFAQ